MSYINVKEGSVVWGGGRVVGTGVATVTSGDMYSVARIEAALKQTPSSKQGEGGFRLGQGNRRAPEVEHISAWK